RTSVDINTVGLLSPDAVLRRSVWLLARPLQAFVPVLPAVVNHSRAICNWGILISPFSKSELEETIKDQYNTVVIWGDFYELKGYAGTVHCETSHYTHRPANRL